MRVLLLASTTDRDTFPPQLGATQIVAGPDWPDAQTVDGQWLSLRTPVGEYDLAALLSKIPVDQKPHAIVCLIDASWRNRPQNLGSFEGEKTLMVMDSDHLVFPLEEMFRYISQERFERVVFLQDQNRLGQYLAELAVKTVPKEQTESLLHDHHHLSRTG